MLDKRGCGPILVSMIKTSFLAVLLCGLMALPAQAAAPAVLTYDVYAGGIHGMNAKLSIEEDASRYDVKLETITIGFLKKLAPWSGVFASTGWVMPGTDRQPETHTSSATWKKEANQKDYKFAKNGEFISYKVTEAGTDKTPEKLDPELTPTGISDVLSTTLEVMARLRAGENCAQTETIFDGDRNFQMIFAQTGTEVLPKSDYNIYQGPAVVCTIEVKPGKGKWHKKPRGWLSLQEQGRKAGTMPTIWFAKLSVAEGAPYVPVKVRVKTDYGTLFMHLTSYQAPDGTKQAVVIKKDE